MMLIDMTNQLGILMAALDVILVFSASAIAIAVWHAQRASLTSRVPVTSPKLAVVGSSSSAPTPTGKAPSDTPMPEAA
jgi:hypothetical protein